MNKLYKILSITSSITLQISSLYASESVDQSASSSKSRPVIKTGLWDKSIQEAQGKETEAAKDIIIKAVEAEALKRKNIYLISFGNLSIARLMAHSENSNSQARANSFSDYLQYKIARINEKLIRFEADARAENLSKFKQEGYNYLGIYSGKFAFMEREQQEYAILKTQMWKKIIDLYEEYYEAGKIIPKPFKHILTLRQEYNGLQNEDINLNPINYSPLWQAKNNHSKWKLRVAEVNHSRIYDSTDPLPVLLNKLDKYKKEAGHLKENESIVSETFIVDASGEKSKGKEKA